jgi:hypothetical protein
VPELGFLSLIHRTFWVPAAAVNLAVVRIAVFSSLSVMALQAHVVEFARVPDDLIVAPPQLGRVLVALPRSPGIATVALWLLVATCVAAAVGWRVRCTALAASVLSFYVLGIPQLYGKVDHYHHLVWLALLLACSPCADRLAVDSRHREAPPSSVRYGFPLRVSWLLIGLCYFFPGLAKLAEAPTWLSTANLRRLLDLQQWAAHGGLGVPSGMLLPLAVGTLVFELGFVFGVFSRRWRPWFLVAGLLFHLGTFATMHILFWNLWILYVSFVDWSRFVGRPAPPDARPPWRSTKVVSTVLVAGVALTGLMSLTATWPFASYPTFAGSFAGMRSASTTQVVAIVDGRPRVAPILDWLPESRRFGVVVNALHHPRTLVELGREAVPDADAIQVWRVIESTRPRTRGDVLSRKLLLEVKTR